MSAGRGVDVPLADAYSLRLNVSRRLYDRGSAMQGSPPMHGLIRPSALCLNHVDLDRLGVTSGTVVSVIGVHGTVSLPVVLDGAVPRGSAEIPFATLSASGEYVLSALVVDAGVYSQIRLETR